MADRAAVCVVCSRKIYRNNPVIECSKCFNWCHKGCSGLSTTEFNKCNNLVKKQQKHNWICTACSDKNVEKTCEQTSLNSAGRRSLSVNNRQSLSFGRRRSMLGNATDTELTSGVLPPLLTNSGPSLLADFNRNISSLLNNRDIEMKDVVILMQQMHLQLFNSITEQNAVTQGILQEIKNIQDGVISQLQSEIVVLREEVENLKSAKSVGECRDDSGGTQMGEASIFTEVQDRALRSYNIMLYNISENKSIDLHVRINHDKSKATEVFNKLDVEAGLFKAIRVGRANSDKVRPLKVILLSSDLVKACLRNKSKLKETGIGLGPDLTKVQRENLNKLRAEMNNRISAGETNLTIRYRLGAPFIGTVKQVGDQREHSKND